MTEERRNVVVDVREQNGLTQAYARESVLIALDQLPPSEIFEVRIIGRESAEASEDLDGGTYDFKILKDSRIPERRNLVVQRLRKIFSRLKGGEPDLRAACYFHGWRIGLLLGDYIAPVDSEDLKEVLPDIPQEIGGRVPQGPDVTDPEVEALGDDALPAPVWFRDWVHIKNEQYYFGLEGRPIPELQVLCWLGFLRASIETGRIGPENCDALRALLPPVQDDFTPLVAAIDFI